MKKHSILFIGNSYTFYNKMPTEIFAKIAEAEGYTLDIDSVTKGAYTLEKFADPTDEYGAKVESALSGDKKYDFVILQEQSLRPATEKVSEFYLAVENLVERIKKTGATPLLYATWGRKSGSPNLENLGLTNESMTKKLAAAYQTIADKLGISVAHVGLAFYDVYTNHGEIDLYHPDMSHPSYAGSYLAAVKLFSEIFDTDSTNITFTGDLSKEAASILCEAAKRATYN